MCINFFSCLYRENMGENIIYLWVEKLREILAEHDFEASGINKSIIHSIEV